MTACFRMIRISTFLSAVFVAVFVGATAKAESHSISILGPVPRDVRTDDLLGFLEAGHFEPLHPKRKLLPKNQFKDRMAFRAACRPVIEAYARHGGQYGVRWDYAVFQMMHETDSLRFTGDAKAANNNFAGIGVTGDPQRWRVEGDTFANVDQGVLAHVQHLAAYAGAFDKQCKEVEQGIDELRRQRPSVAELEGRLTKAGVPREPIAVLAKKLKPADYELFLMKRVAAVEVAVKHGIVAPRTRFTWYHDIRKAATFADLAGRWAADKRYGDKLAEYAADFATFVERRRTAERGIGTDLRPWIGRRRITSRHTYGAYRNTKAESDLRISIDRVGRLQVVHGTPATILAATPNRLLYRVAGGVNSVTVELFREGKSLKGNFCGTRRNDGTPIGGVIVGMQAN